MPGGQAQCESLKEFQEEFPSWRSGNELTRNHEVAGWTPSLAQWIKDPALCELWCGSQRRLGSGVAVAVA